LFYGRSSKYKPKEEWQSNLEHLVSVAENTSKFASVFDSSRLGYIKGLFHDYGKYSKPFQDRITGKSSERVDHSTAGCQYLISKMNILGHLLAYSISGHHGGLLDGRSEDQCLEKRLNKELPSCEHGLKEIGEIEFPTFDDLPLFMKKAINRKDGFSVSFYVRMLLSCLVDADRLDAEKNTSKYKASHRPVWPEDIFHQMFKSLNDYINDMEVRDSIVNKQREMVRRDCLLAAVEKNKGFFSLTVPTGGGKTFSSLAFAILHAIVNKMDRIFYVIPLTSIIEQNAEEFRKALKKVSEALGKEVVLEHHCNFDTEKAEYMIELTSENWDMPLVVTTSVRFYESLYSSSSSACRRLHNLVNSVIILDEAQTLAVDYIEPCLRGLKELVDNYDCSIVLCTATQPAINYKPEFHIGLHDVREIISDTKTLFDTLRRVNFVFLGNKWITDTELKNRLKMHDQVICIVNIRDHAKILYDMLIADGVKNVFHLSALMCPAHRKEVIKTVRKKFDNGEKCILVSTQIIEAGIDISSPVVYRAQAGLDSIIQAGGRCNRHGEIEKGTCYIFCSEHPYQEIYFRDMAQCARTVIDLCEDGKFDDITSTECVELYFRHYYLNKKGSWDKKHILDNFHMYNNKDFPFGFQYKTASDDFSIIDEKSETIIVPWDKEGEELCQELRKEKPTCRLLRKLQKFCFSLNKKKITKACDRKKIELVHDRYYILLDVDKNYSQETGFLLETPEEGE